MTEKKNPLDLMTKMYLDGIKKAVELLKQNGNEITEETVAQKNRSADRDRNQNQPTFFRHPITVHAKLSKPAPLWSRLANEVVIR